MKQIRIAHLMGIITFVAVGIAAMTSPTPLWASALLTFALAVLGFATLAALCRGDGSRAFWAGLAITGWGYLALNYGPLADARIGPRLATTLLIDGLYRRTEYSPSSKGESVWVDFGGDVRPGTVRTIDERPGGTQFGLVVDFGTNTGSTTADRRRLRAIDPEGYRVLGHALFCPVIGLFGGIAASLMVARGGRRPSEAHLAREEIPPPSRVG